MRSRGLALSFIALSLLLLVAGAVPAGAQMGVWRDTNPTAYIQPTANPNMTSVYMLSANEGWAVSDFRPTSNATTGLPGVFHYDGSTWNLVPIPRFPDFASHPSPYNLTSVSFGPPKNPISRNDGWAVGFNNSADFTACKSAAPAPGEAPCSSVAIHWDGIAWRAQTAGLSGASAGPLWSVFMVSSTDAWAVGQSVGVTPEGVFWHWTGVPGLGGGWNLPQALNPTVGPLYSVFMVSPTEGWAVGASLGGGSNIYHYTGGAWTSFPSPVLASSLRSVFMVSPTDGWAVGDGGVILHYTGGIWTGPVSPGTTTNNLVGVFMVSSTEGWAVGRAGTILHYLGGAWNALPTTLVPTSPVAFLDFHSVYYNSASDGWIVGTSGLILHFDGSNFGAVTSPTIDNFTSISFGPPLTGPANPNDGWAVGNASAVSLEPTIYHWNGFMWTKGVAIGAQNDLNSVYMLNTGDVWAVGGGPHPTSTCVGVLCPVILHFTGGAWNTLTPPAGNYRLKSVFMISQTEGWAVGQIAGLPPSGIILHYTVTGGVGAWATFPVPASNGYGVAPLPSLNSVFMLNSNEGWALGDNATILHYTVTGGVGTWNPVIVSGSPGISKLVNLTSIFMLSPTSGWAVGGVTLDVTNPGAFSTGPVILYWDGTKWSPVPAPQIPGGVSPDGGPILNSQGSSQVRIPSAVLKSVYCTGPTDCWATGFPGKLFATIFHWDGVAWNFVTLSPGLLGQDASLKGIPPILTSVYMTSPTSGWIVGSSYGSTSQSPFLGKPLSTILRFAPFGGVFSETTTVTQVSTLSTSTIASTTTISTTTSVFTVPGTVQVTIKVVDGSGNAVQGANVTIAALGLKGVTNSQGVVTFTVPLGTYALVISKGSASANPSVNVVSSGQTFTLTLPVAGAGIPGFPVESILAGIIVGLAALSLLRRRRIGRVAG
jgi:photosystem II stability/assembly factor-like uncharacterized protein